jgi:hypothetical protein
MVLIRCAMIPVHGSRLAGSRTTPIVIGGSCSILPVVDTWVGEFGWMSQASVFDIEDLRASRTDAMEEN